MQTLFPNIPSYFTHIESAVPQEDGSVLCQIKCSDGAAGMKLYSVMPGILLIGHNFHTSVCACMEPVSADIIEINHCMEGRAECKMQDGCCLYISEGDLFLSRMSNHSRQMEFPLGHYRGISLLIDVEEAGNRLPDILCAIPLDLSAMFDRFFAEDDCFLLRGRAAIASIFSDLYTAPESVRKAYFQLKVQELFLFLFCLEEKQEGKKKAYTAEQVGLVKQLQKQLVQNPDRRFGIEELAQQYCISATALKSYFKGIYGMPIAAYMKEYRMRQAALLLEEGTQSISQIAKEVGYENQSKFAAAFKEVMGQSPLQYRKIRIS